MKNNFAAKDVPERSDKYPWGAKSAKKNFYIYSESVGWVANNSIKAGS
jgi:hypothetical protein